MIRVEGLTKRYGDTLAVDDLSFEVKPGIVTGFLGPNGAGKSTTMRMILGLDRPTSGTATIDGTPYAKLARPLHTVGALLDAKWVHPNRSARAHLQWLAAAGGIDGRRVDEVLDLVGLSSQAKKNAGGFSLGMSQRLGLAAALLGDPQVLLLDEPVNGLDPEGIHWVRTFLQQLAADGRTVLVSSHLLSEMAQTAHHLVVIGRGRLIADTPVQDFIDQATETATIVRGPDLAALETALRGAGWSVAAHPADRLRPAHLIVTGTETDRIGELAAARGLVLHELSGRAGSLEEAFIKLTAAHVEYQTAGVPTVGAETGEVR